MRPVRFLLSLTVLLVFTSTAHASLITIDYGTALSTGYQASNTATISGVTAEGFVVGQTAPANSVLPILGGIGTLVNANLYVRNDGASSDDVGLGVCSEGQSACDANGGDVNELENSGTMEMIRLTRPSNFGWSSFTLSSLDGNSGGAPERGLLYQGATNDPSAASFVQAFGFGSTGEGPFNITGLSQYLFFVAWDWTGNGNTNNDYLLKEVVIDDNPQGDVPVPEPATLTLLGLGMAAGAARRRLQKKN